MEENNRYRFEEESEINKSSEESLESEEIKLDSEENEVAEEENKTVDSEETSNEFSKETRKEKKDRKDKEIHKLKEENEALKEEITNLKNELLKVKAEEINFKKCLEEDKTKMISYANQKVLEKFVNHIDLFDKVVSYKPEDPALKNYLIGFEMINNNFKQVLEEEGVKKVAVEIGKELDPRYHQAFQTEWNEEYPEGVVLQELQTGYTYKERLLRPALVKVNKKEGK